MAFRTRRQNRYKVLRDNYFLPFEAQALSKVPFNTPYMHRLIMDRRKEARQAIKRNSTRKEWETQIKVKYLQNDWIRGKRLNPWDYLRNYEDNFKDTHPAYDSPWQKRQRSWRDFLKKTEATIQMQQGSQPLL